MASQNQLLTFAGNAVFAAVVYINTIYINIFDGMETCDTRQPTLEADVSSVRRSAVVVTKNLQPRAERRVQNYQAIDKKLGVMRKQAAVSGWPSITIVFEQADDGDGWAVRMTPTGDIAHDIVKTGTLQLMLYTMLASPALCAHYAEAFKGLSKPAESPQLVSGNNMTEAAAVAAEQWHANTDSGLNSDPTYDLQQQQSGETGSANDLQQQQSGETGSANDLQQQQSGETGSAGTEGQQQELTVTSSMPLTQALPLNEAFVVMEAVTQDAVTSNTAEVHQGLDLKTAFNPSHASSSEERPPVPTCERDRDFVCVDASVAAYIDDDTSGPSLAVDTGGKRLAGTKRKRCTAAK